MNETLRTFLSQPGWTQKKLASALGVREATVSGWVNGTRPRPTQMERIAETTGGAVPIQSWFSAGAVKAPEPSDPERGASARSAFDESAGGRATGGAVRAAEFAGIAPAPETEADAGDAGAARDASPGAAPSGPAEPAAGMQAPAAGHNDSIEQGDAA